MDTQNDPRFSEYLKKIQMDGCFNGVIDINDVKIEAVRTLKNVSVTVWRSIKNEDAFELYCSTIYDPVPLDAAWKFAENLSEYVSMEFHVPCSVPEKENQNRDRFQLEHYAKEEASRRLQFPGYQYDIARLLGDPSAEARAYLQDTAEQHIKDYLETYDNAFSDVEILDAAITDAIVETSRKYPPEKEWEGPEL
jgi:hypothetical protein